MFNTVHPSMKLVSREDKPFVRFKVDVFAEDFPCNLARGRSFIPQIEQFCSGREIGTKIRWLVTCSPVRLRPRTSKQLIFIQPEFANHYGHTIHYIISIN